MTPVSIQLASFARTPTAESSSFQFGDPDSSFISPEELEILNQRRNKKIIAHKRVVSCVGILGLLYAVFWVSYRVHIFRTLYFPAFDKMESFFVFNVTEDQTQHLPFTDSSSREEFNKLIQLDERKARRRLRSVGFIVFSAFFWFMIPCVGWCAVGDTPHSALYRFHYSFTYMGCTCLGACVAAVGFSLTLSTLMFSVPNIMDMTLIPFRNLVCPVHDIKRSCPAIHKESSDNDDEAVDFWSRVMWEGYKSDEHAVAACNSSMVARYTYCQPPPRFLDCAPSGVNDTVHVSPQFREFRDMRLIKEFRGFGSFASFGSLTSNCSHGKNFTWAEAECSDERNSWCIAYSYSEDHGNATCLHKLNTIPEFDITATSWIKNNNAHEHHLRNCSMNWDAFSAYENVSADYYGALKTFDASDDVYQFAQLVILVFALGLGLLGCRSGFKFYRLLNEAFN